MLRTLLFSLLTLPLLTACVSASQSSAGPEQAVARAACSRIMRLQSFEAQFDGCVDSLSQTLAQRAEVRAVQVADRDCAGHGLKPNTPEFAHCVLDTTKAQPTAAVSQDVAYVQPIAGDTDSYFYTNFAQRRRREQYSCAALGLDPASAGFRSCVDNLEATLFDLDHPFD